MCIYEGKWQNTEIKFLAEKIFREKGQLVVNSPINSDENNNNFVPKKIALSFIHMDKEKKQEIILKFIKTEKEKTAAKLKRQKK